MGKGGIFCVQSFACQRSACTTRWCLKLLMIETRVGARAVDLGWPSVYQGRPKFEIKHKSRCLQKRKVVNWGSQACRLEGQAPLSAGPDLNFTTVKSRKNFVKFKARLPISDMRLATNFFAPSLLYFAVHG